MFSRFEFDPPHEKRELLAKGGAQDPSSSQSRSNDDEWKVPYLVPCQSGTSSIARQPFWQSHSKGSQFAVPFRSPTSGYRPSILLAEWIKWYSTYKSVSRPWTVRNNDRQIWRCSVCTLLQFYSQRHMCGRALAVPDSSIPCDGMQRPHSKIENRIPTATCPSSFWQSRFSLDRQSILLRLLETRELADSPIESERELRPEVCLE
jgi:hypothetical protein